MLPCLFVTCNIDIFSIWYVFHDGFEACSCDPRGVMFLFESFTHRYVFSYFMVDFVGKALPRLL